MLLEVVVSSVAVVLAHRMNVFRTTVGKILFYAGIAGVAGIAGPCLRGHPESALVIGPVVFALTAGAIQLLDHLARRRANRS